MGGGLGAGFGGGVGDGEQFHAIQGGVFGGVMMTEHARADHGGLQRSIFRHSTAKEQGLKFPSENLPL